MFFKILGSTIIGLMLIAGCKSGGNQEGEKEKEQPSLQEQQMPEQMQQQDIEVSDEEIQKFVDAVKKIQSIDRGTQQEMVKTVEDEGMSTQRFREIQKSQQSQEGQGDITDEEKKQYQRIMQKFQNLQAGMQE